jgi:hypothetical protein
VLKPPSIMPNTVTWAEATAGTAAAIAIARSDSSRVSQKLLNHIIINRL